MMDDVKEIFRIFEIDFQIWEERLKLMLFLLNDLGYLTLCLSIFYGYVLNYWDILRGYNMVIFQVLVGKFLVRS